ncbi:MAG: polysaccharide pyruvyl transferase family protein [Myxococcota bacterium]
MNGTSLLRCIVICLSLSGFAYSEAKQGLPLWYWRQPAFTNFGDYLSLKIVERMVNRPVRVYNRRPANNDKKLLAVGSILSFADTGDVVWGSGINGKLLAKKAYGFRSLEVRSVRGPLTRKFLKDEFGIDAPAIYGDPALLVPRLFPEFRRKEKPANRYLFIPHYSEMHRYPKDKYPNVIYPTDPWNEVIEAITDSELVVSSSLHGVIIAEAFGIPARMIIADKEPLFKYQDYYLGTGRADFNAALSVEEAVRLGGEPPIKIDLQALYDAFPFEYWQLNENG